MDKAGARVVADPAQLQGDGRSPDVMQVGTRDGNVDSFTNEVEAMLGNVAAIVRQNRIVGWGPVAGDDVYLVAPSQSVVDQVEEFDGFDVHDRLLIGVVAAQYPVYRIEGFDVIGPVGFSEGD